MMPFGKLFRLRRGVALLLCLACAACHDRVVARIQVPTDTTEFNSNEFRGVDVRFVNQHDEVITPEHVVYRSLTPSVVTVSANGAVWCKEDGVGAISVSADSAHAQAPIRCRIVHYFSPPAVVRLIAGGPPVPFGVSAYDKDGNLMPAVRLRIAISDSTVVALRDGMVYGLKPGGAGISVRSGGRGGGEVFFVEKPDDPRKAADSSARGTSSRPAQRSY